MLAINKDILFTIFNIIVLFLFLRHFLFKPVTEMIAKRQKAVEDTLQDADGKKAEAYQLKSDYEKEMKNVAEQATVIFKEARERAEIEYSRILKEAKEEAVKVIADANVVIELERKRTMESAQAEIASIAMMAAAKIIGKNVDENTSKQFLGDFLNEVGAAK